MIVGLLQVEVHFPEPNSLKAKRALLKSLLARVRNTFNVSIAETGGHNLWQRATLAASMVGNEQSHLNRVLDKLVGFIRSEHSLHIIDYHIEFL